MAIIFYAIKRKYALRFAMLHDPHIFAAIYGQRSHEA